MALVLRLHPDCRCAAPAHIEVDVARPGAGVLALSYVVTGRIAELRLPPVVASARGDELWRETCFEAFIGTAPGAAYYEFNFAPSTKWAAYRFGGYRKDMQAATEIGAPAVAVQSASDRYALRASLRLDALSLPRDTGWRLGLAAITEETNVGRSYWALRHPPGKADFHHFDCFAHEIAGA